MALIHLGDKKPQSILSCGMASDALRRDISPILREATVLRITIEPDELRAGGGRALCAGCAAQA